MQYVVIGCHTGAVLEDGCDLATAQAWARGYSPSFAAAVAGLKPGERVYSEGGPQYLRRASIGIRVSRLVGHVVAGTNGRRVV